MEIRDEHSNADKLNLDKLEQLLLSTEQQIKNSLAHEIVLVIGLTGSGKSTFINYMQGQQLSIMFDHDQATSWLDVEEGTNSLAQKSHLTSPKIGSGKFSETKVPDVYACHQDYLLCDTAGFADNRGKEEDLCSYLAVQLAVRYAAKIKGIVVVIEVPSMEATRGDGLNRLARVLNQLVADHQYLESSVLFAFTKAYAANGSLLSPHQIKNRLKNYAQAMAETNNVLLGDLYRRMAEHSAILVPDFLDKKEEEGLSRNAIFERIKSFKDIPKDQFILSIDERDYAGFREIVTKIATSFLDKVALLDRNHITLNGIKTHLSALTSRIEELQQENTRFKQDGLDMSAYLTEQERLLQDKEQMLVRKSQEVESSRNQLLAANDTAHRAEQAAAACQPYKVTITETRRRGGMLAPISNFVLGGVEVTREEIRYPDNYNEVHTQWAEARKAQQTFENALKGLEDDKANAASIVADIRKRLNDFKLTRAKRDVEAKEIIHRNDVEITRHQTAITEFTTRQVTLEQEDSRTREELTQEDAQYQMIVRINRYFDFKEPEVYAFITRYQHYIEAHDNKSEWEEEMRSKPLASISDTHQHCFFSTQGSKEPNYPRDRLVNSDKKSRIPGLIFESVLGDGHCLYRAVSLYLNRDVSDLRHEVSDKLNELSDFIALPPGRTLEDYRIAVRDSNEWASHVEIAALMRVLDRPIIVIDSHYQITNPEDAGRFTGDPIFVYYNGIDHYDALVLAPSTDGRELLNTLLTQADRLAFNLSFNL